MNFQCILVSIFTVSVFGLVLSFTSDDLRVTLSNGNKLVGRYFRSYRGRPIKGFLGIPYARPPIGHLRFKNPEPFGKWDGEFEAIYDGQMCIQLYIISNTITGSEDCLTLNVYVPLTEITSGLSVMVLIHGGAFKFLSSRSSAYGPDHLLDQDVIFVSANFRLGIVGFLSTEDEHCPGNLGLKDLALVLKWIQENIKQFGGDPNSVTVFGGSSGAAIATYLMISPLTKNMLSKVIAYSGTNLSPWAEPAQKGEARRKAIRLAERFNCYEINNWPKTIECLRKVPAANFITALQDMVEFDKDPKVVFPPVIEPDLPGAFITEHSREMMKRESYNIPFLTGAVFDEGLARTSYYFSQQGKFDKFIEHFVYVLPLAFGYNHLDLRIQQSITSKINQFYFDNNLTIDKYDNVTNLFGDAWFLGPMDAFLRLRFAHDNVAPTYMYLLTHNTSLSYTEVFGPDRKRSYGVSHGEEEFFLYPKRSLISPSALPTKQEVQIQEAMTQMWVNFVRTGDPTPQSTTLPKWERVNQFPVNYYRIGNFHFDNKPMFGMEYGGIFEDRVAFWRNLSTVLPPSNTAKDEL